MNCFCSLKDWYLLQQFEKLEKSILGCELLLFFERLIFATTLDANGMYRRRLWIAFVLWKIDICYNSKILIRIEGLLWIAFVLWKIDICYNLLDNCIEVSEVVNCFCSLKDWYLLQPILTSETKGAGCELLLFFERLIFATTFLLLVLQGVQLWIAFVLWKIDICYN